MENWDMLYPGGYGNLAVDTNQVWLKLVTNSNAYHKAINYLSEENILGIDAEWEPGYGQREERLAVLQIASRDRVYVFQILRLDQFLSKDEWRRLGNEVLANDNITKLGYHVVQDIRKLLKTIPVLRPCFADVTMPEILDLRTMEIKMENLYWDIFSEMQNYRNSERGLSKLVCCFLGAPLDKSEQNSNWEDVPLTYAQTYYAALDAYILLPLFEGMRSCLMQNEEVDMMEQISLSSVHLLKPSNSKKRAPSPSPPCPPPMVAVPCAPSPSPPCPPPMVAVPWGYCAVYHTKGIFCPFDDYCMNKHQCWLCHCRHPSFQLCCTPPGYCNLYHSPDSWCPYNYNCQYIHRCWKCDQPHPNYWVCPLPRNNSDYESEYDYNYNSDYDYDYDHY